MRGLLTSIVAAAAVGFASAASAQSGYSIYNAWPGARVIHLGQPDGNAPPDVLVRRHLVRNVPTQLLDPSDARPPVYIVNQGGWHPHLRYYAVPTYSEGGYAYVGAYPWGVGSYYGYGGIGPEQVNRSAVYQLGYRPYSSYGYRVPPTARVIQIGPQPAAPAPAPAQRPAPAR
jgi:hypothetical protein